MNQISPEPGKLFDSGWWGHALDCYKAGSKGGGDRGVYLRLFNGGPYTIDRVIRGAFSISNWSACFFGGMQPGPIQQIAKASAEDGLLQRFIYVVPGPQNRGVDCTPDGDALKRYSDLFLALVKLHPPQTADGKHRQVVTFHEDAQRHRTRVEDLARAMTQLPDTSTRMRAAYGKWPGIYARLALVFHLVTLADGDARQIYAGNALTISEDTAGRAARFMVEIILPHMLRADAMMFATAQTNHAERIAGWIIIHKLERVTARMSCGTISPCLLRRIVRL